MTEQEKFAEELRNKTADAFGVPRSLFELDKDSEAEFIKTQIAAAVRVAASKTIDPSFMRV